MKIFRLIGSMAFVLGLFTIIFIGMLWYIITNSGFGVPWRLKMAILCLIGGILLILLPVALEQKKMLVISTATVNLQQQLLQKDLKYDRF